MSLNKWKTNDLPKPDGRTPSTSFFLTKDSFNNWLLLCFQFEIAIFTSFSQSEIQRFAK